MRDDQRAGRWSAQEARGRQLEFLRGRWLVIGKMVALLSALVGLVAVASPSVARPYVIGAGLASVGWYLVVFVVVMAGTGSYLLGSYGEQWTSDVLRRLRRHGWCLLEHVPLVNSDIDHVLLGPGGAFAVETKNTSGEWDLDLPDDDLRRKVAQTRWCANRLRILLLQDSIRMRTEVRAVLVLWGPAASSGRTMIDGVEVVLGRDLSAWRASLPTDVLTPEQVEHAAAGLADYIVMRDAHIRTRHRLPMVVDIGPFALLNDVCVAFFGFATGLIALAGAFRFVGGYALFPVLAAFLLGGMYGLRQERARSFSAGWLAASTTTTVVFVAVLGAAIT